MPTTNADERLNLIKHLHPGSINLYQDLPPEGQNMTGTGSHIGSTSSPNALGSSSSTPLLFSSALASRLGNYFLKFSTFIPNPDIYLIFNKSKSKRIQYMYTYIENKKIFIDCI